MLSCAFRRSLGAMRPRTMTKGEAISLPRLFKYNCNVSRYNPSTIYTPYFNCTMTVLILCDVCVFIPISMGNNNIADDLIIRIIRGGGGAGTQAHAYAYDNKQTNNLFHSSLSFPFGLGGLASHPGVTALTFDVNVAADLSSISDSFFFGAEVGCHIAAQALAVILLIVNSVLHNHYLLCCLGCSLLMAL